MENERIDTAKKIYELGQQLKRAQELSGAAANPAAMQAMGSLYTPAAGGPHGALPSANNGAFSFQPTPMQPITNTPRRHHHGGNPAAAAAAHLMNSPSSFAPMSPMTSNADISGQLHSIKVYVGSNEDRNLLGEVALGPNVTLGDVRRMIQAQFRLTQGFSLRKKKIPIRQSQDHHKAHDFLKAIDDYLIVD